MPIMRKRRMDKILKVAEEIGYTTLIEDRDITNEYKHIRYKEGIEAAHAYIMQGDNQLKSRRYLAKMVKIRKIMGRSQEDADSTAKIAAERGYTAYETDAEIVNQFKRLFMYPEKQTDYRKLHEQEIKRYMSFIGSLNRINLHPSNPVNKEVKKEINKATSPVSKRTTFTPFEIYLIGMVDMNKNTVNPEGLEKLREIKYQLNQGE